jgi:predicted O-methyltransferase YrrM
VKYLHKKWLRFIPLFLLLVVQNIHAAAPVAAPQFYSSDSQLLRDPAFIALKMHMVDYLKGSWCSEEKTRLLMDTIVATQPQVCVEIGVFTGSSALPIAVTLKHLKRGVLFAVDAWSNVAATRNLAENDPNKKWWSEVNMALVYQEFQKALSTWRINSYCQILHETSSSAIQKIPDIDFLHIDGNYSEEGSLEDVELYLPKVKKGGYVLMSNIHWSINNIPSRRKAVQRLLDSCIIVGVAENNNCLLVRKI